MEDVNNSFSASFIKPNWPLLLPKTSKSDINNDSHLLVKYLAYHAAAVSQQQQPAKDIIYPWMREGHPGNNLMSKIPFHYDPSGTSEAPLSPDPTPPISLSPGKLKWMSKVQKNLMDCTVMKRDY